MRQSLNLCSQVSPKELILGRNNLSSITARKVAAPPVPLTLSTTQPHDFAEEAVQNLDVSHLSSETKVCHTESQMFKNGKHPRMQEALFAFNY